MGRERERELMRERGGRGEGREGKREEQREREMGKRRKMGLKADR